MVVYEIKGCCWVTGGAPAWGYRVLLGGMAKLQGCCWVGRQLLHPEMEGYYLVSCSQGAPGVVEPEVLRDVLLARAPSSGCVS